MKPGKTLIELARELDLRAAAKADFIAKADAIQFLSQPDGALAVRLNDDPTLEFKLSAGNPAEAA
jgi:hypothetical protein